LVILFIYISNVFPLPSFPSTSRLSPPPSPCLYEGAPPPFHPLLSQQPSGSLSWIIKGLFSQWCQIRQSSATYPAGAMGPPHVYSLVGGLVPGSSGDTGGWYCCSSYGVAAPWVLLLALPLGTLCSVQCWLRASTSVFVRHWGNPITKEYTWYGMVWTHWLVVISPQAPEYARINSQTMWSSRTWKTKVWILQSFLEGGTKYPWEETQRLEYSKMLSWGLRDDVMGGFWSDTHWAVLLCLFLLHFTGKQAQLTCTHFYYCTHRHQNLHFVSLLWLG
jgi:hypothetical protein